MCKEGNIVSLVEAYLRDAVKDKGEPLVGHTTNSLAQNASHSIGQLHANCYSVIPKEECRKNIVLTLGLVNIRCVSKVCDLHEVVKLCVNRFDSNYKVIKLDREGKI
jgi:hypothetical protein